MSPLRAALVLVLASACGGDEGMPTGPNVLLVTLDTTRADRLGCYGYAAARTPAIDALAEAGARFDAARSPVPLTLPSHASLLTGVHPAAHGLHVNFQGAVSDEARTLAEALRGCGYRTGAFVAAWVLNREFGLARGFDRYDDVKDRTGRRAQQAERRGDEVCDAALAWLDEGGDGPFFAWVHFFDAHHPYAPPPSFAGDDLYDGEIAFADAQLARLVAWLDANGLREDTLVIVAGDHGESLGEHGEKTHGLFVYDSVVRVPLVVAWPGRIDAGRVVEEPVGLVDVVPTVLALIAADPGHELDGRNLVGALRGDALPLEPILVESEYPLHSFGWAPLRALVSGEWKYIEAPAPELYRLGDDPNELTNLFASEPDRAARMREALATRLASTTRRSAGAAQIDSGDLEQLGNLGYAGGLGQDVGFDEAAGLRDTKASLHLYAGAVDARGLAADEQHQEVVDLLIPWLADSPESDELWSLMGRAQYELGRFLKAEGAYRKSLRARPDDTDRMTALGDAQRRQGRPDDALTTYRRALSIDGSNGKLHSRAGLMLAQRGELEAALSRFRRHTDLEPDSPSAHCNVGNALMGLRRPREAEVAFRGALEIDAACGQAHATLWRALHMADRRREAVDALRTAHVALPQVGFDLELAWQIAIWDGATTAETREAVQLARAVLDRSTAPRVLDVFAAALAATREFDDAEATAMRAISQMSLDPEALSAVTREAIQSRAKLYRARKPYRE